MHSSPVQDTFAWLRFRPALAWVGILGLVLITGLGILAGAGGILRLLFPLGATIVGGLLYVRYPLLYVGFTWWIWFLTQIGRAHV